MFLLEAINLVYRFSELDFFSFSENLHLRLSIVVFCLCKQSSTLKAVEEHEEGSIDRAYMWSLL